MVFSTRFCSFITFVNMRHNLTSVKNLLTLIDWTYYNYCNVKPTTKNNSIKTNYGSSSNSSTNLQYICLRTNVMQHNLQKNKNIMEGYNCLIENVLSSWRNLDIVSHATISGGRLFHNRAPATANNRSPTVCWILRLADIELIGEWWPQTSSRLDGMSDKCSLIMYGWKFLTFMPLRSRHNCSTVYYSAVSRNV